MSKILVASVLFAVEFIAFPIEFGQFAIEFIAFAVEFVVFAQQFVKTIILAAINQSLITIFTLKH